MSLSNVSESVGLDLRNFPITSLYGSPHGSSSIEAISLLQDLFLAFLMATLRARLASLYSATPTSKIFLRLFLVRYLRSRTAVALRAEILSDHQYTCLLLFVTNMLGIDTLHESFMISDNHPGYNLLRRPNYFLGQVSRG